MDRTAFALLSSETGAKEYGCLQLRCTQCPLFAGANQRRSGRDGDGVAIPFWRSPGSTSSRVARRRQKIELALRSRADAARDQF